MATPHRLRRALAVGATAALAVTGLAVAAQPATAAPNECGTVYIDKAYPWDYEGRLVHSCSGGTQVTYTIDCFFNDQTVTHYFAYGQSISIPVTCHEPTNTLIGATFSF
ncbi:hypothetical protein IF650_05950 [Cellulosimicrobium terreum]|nr:hypothetical protein [Cellulosimicrobium terreum]